MNFLLSLAIAISFSAEFSQLKPGESIPKSFAVKYLQADASSYGSSLKYELRFKPEFYATSMPALVYNVSDKTCDEDYLIIFNEDGSIKSELKIFARCDHDQRIATYKTWSFEMEPEESMIYLSVRGVTVKDKSKVDEDGKVVGTNSLLNLETESFSKMEMYAVLEDGSIQRL